MATFEEQTDTVVNRVYELSDIATDAYKQARRTLESLAANVEAMPASMVDLDIGVNLNMNWSGAITEVTTPTEPTYIDDALAVMPNAPTVPAVSVTVPEFDGTDPAMPTDTLADISETLPIDPTAIAAPSFSVLSDLGAVPEITAVVPTISLAALTTEFSFTEPVYTEQISSTVKTQLARVLGGDLGIPSAVWSAMWNQVAGDLARQQVGRLRLARNRGAASYWAMPSETALVASRAIADEGARSLQLDRLQKAVAEATMKREDFWQAVQHGIALEGIWIGFHESMAQRALGAAEQLANVQIQVHNANVQRYNLLIEAAKLQGTIDDLGVNRLLKGYEVSLKKSEIETTQSKAKVEHFQSLWEGYKVKASAVASLSGAQNERFAARTGRAQMAVQKFGEEIKYWNGVLDAELKSKSFLLQKADTEAKNYATQYGTISALASATSALIEGRTASEKLKLDWGIATVNAQKAMNDAAIEVGRLTQAAQETKAKLEIAQMEWMNGQGISIQQRISELAFGYAQAAVSASQVSLSSQNSIDTGLKYSASQNEDKKWSGWP